MMITPSVVDLKLSVKQSSDFYSVFKKVTGLNTDLIRIVAEYVIERFGAAEWRDWYGIEVDSEPKFPDKLIDFLFAPDSVDRVKFIFETHLPPVLRPQFYIKDGEKYFYNLNNLGILIQNPKNKGHKAQYKCKTESLKQHGKIIFEKTEWIFMRKDVIGRNVNYEGQEKEIYQLNKRAPIDLVTLVFACYVETGERYLGSNGKVGRGTYYSRCLEQLQCQNPATGEEFYRLIKVGGFNPSLTIDVDTRKYVILPNDVPSSFVCKINYFVKLNKKHFSNVSWKTNERKRFFIKWDKNQEMLLLFFPREDTVGSGFWKKFFASRTIKILLTAKKKEISEFESVWIEADNKTVNEVRIQDLLYKQYIKEKPIGVYFLEPWEQIYQNIYMQRRLINTLDGAEFNNPFQKSHYIRDIARNLAWMHKQRMVHGDVSLKNILLEERVDDENLLRLVSYLTDFGSTKTWGVSKDRKLDDYVRWDPCKCFADINTPLMDWYGFIITNILAWFPEMTAHLKWKNFISIRQIVFDNESLGNFFPDASYWTGPKPLNNLTLEEQQAWHLFISICRKSTQLYLHFKESLGEISKEEVEQAMVKVNASETIEECLLFADAMCEKSK